MVLGHTSNSVTVETVYLQRSGHVMLVEVHNEGAGQLQVWNYRCSF